MEHGLPQDTVQAMAQTADGYLWLGTRDGLARFDGAAFTVFDSQNTPALVSDAITSLFRDRHGSLWIGTSTGIVVLRGGRFERPSSLASLGVVLSIAEDGEGAMWFASPREGLYRFAEGRLSSLGGDDVESGASAWSVRVMGVDLFIGMSTGLYRVKGRQFERIRRGPYANSAIYSIFGDGERLWMASSRGLLQYDGTAIERIAELPGDEASLITGDRHGAIWIGNRRGLWRWYQGMMSHLGSDDGLQIVNSVFIDDDETLWVGSYSGGLNQYRDGVIVPYSKREGMANDTVWSVDGEGEVVWAGTENGVMRLHRGKWSAVQAMDGKLVYTVSADGAGGVWAGTADQGLYHVRGDRVRIYTKADGLPSNSVTALLRDREGGLWVGTAAGLARLYEGNIRRYSDEGKSWNIITALHEDRHGRVWVGSNGTYTRVVEGGRVSDGFRGTPLPRQAVGAIYEDSRGDVWFSTRQGIFRLHSREMFLYTSRHGLPNALVSHFFEDHRGFMWMACTAGIFRVAKEDLDAVLKSPERRFSVVLYGVRDGLPSSEAASHSYPTVWRATDGRAWIATARGIGVLDPRAKRPPLRHAPRVQSVTVDERRMSPNAAVLIAAGANRVEFQYAVPTFNAPEAVIFQYRLEGYDEEWVAAGNRRVAYYTRLPPGSYRFSVQAAVPDTNWIAAPEQVLITVPPPIYRTTWFLALCALAVAVALWVLHYVRLRAVRARHEAVSSERSRIARDFHDTMAQGLTGLSLHLEGAIRSLDDPQRAEELLQKAKTLARSSLTETRRVLSDLRSERLEGATLPVALQQMLELMTEDLPVRGTLTVRGEVRALSDPKAEGHLLRIAEEAVTNALKHARAKNVEIRLQYEPKSVSLSVRDDGLGSDKFVLDDLPTSTYGVRGMRERAHDIGAKFTVRQRKGIEIAVELKA